MIFREIRNTYHSSYVEHRQMVPPINGYQWRVPVRPRRDAHFVARGHYIVHFTAPLRRARVSSAPPFRGRDVASSSS